MERVVMALKWFTSSAFTQASGHADNDTMMQQKEGGAKMLQDTTEEETFQISREAYLSDFQMPLHYPRYTKADYEKMEEWKLDMVLKEYGLNNKGSLDVKRAFAVGSFIWSN